MTLYGSNVIYFIHLDWTFVCFLIFTFYYCKYFCHEENYSNTAGSQGTVSSRAPGEALCCCSSLDYRHQGYGENICFWENILSIHLFFYFRKLAVMYAKIPHKHWKCANCQGNIYLQLINRILSKVNKHSIMDAHRLKI